MRLTRTTPPASEAQLRAELANRTANLEIKRSRRAELLASASDLVGDPAHECAETEIAELEARIAVEERILNRVTGEIPKAAQRECLATFYSRHSALEKGTEKLARTFRKRYPELAEPLAALLNELRENDRAWEALRREARALGTEGGLGHSAEVRARIDLPGARIGGVYHSLLSETQIPAWEDPRPLFDADLIPRR